MKKTIFFVVMAFFALTISSCNDPLEETIADYSGDGVINESELALIEKRISNDRYLKNKYNKEGILKKIRDMNLNVNTSKTEDLPSEVSQRNDSINFNIYLENSGSMFGYINGRTEMEEALMGLWTEIVKYNETLSINFVNDKIYPIEKEFEEFFNYLQPAKVSNIGETRNSNIAYILNMVVKELIENEQPALVLSDFIFSLEKGGEIVNQLSVQKYGLKSIIIQNKLKENGLGILVIKLNSVFDGRYYDFENKPTVLKDEKRPYYIWVIGKVGLLKAFPKRYNISELNGYDNHTLLYSAENAITPYYTILKKTNLKGKFDKKDRNVEQIKEIKNISSSNRDKLFQFSVAVDLSDVSVSNDYLQDINNYSMSPNPDDIFSITSIVKVDETAIEKIDKKLLNNSTHIITLSATKVKSGEHTLGIALLKQLPKWIERSSIDNDKDIESLEGKTFGFKYLIEGVNDGFRPLDHSDEKYVYLDFKLKR